MTEFSSLYELGKAIMDTIQRGYGHDRVRTSDGMVTLVAINDDCELVTLREDGTNKNYPLKDVFKNECL